MVKNNFKEDIRALMDMEGLTWGDMSSRLQISRSSALKYSCGGFSSGMESICDRLGYDIVVKYRKGSLGEWNNYCEDLSMLCESRGMTKIEAERKFGLYPKAMFKYSENAGFSKGLMKLLNELGYGVELEYVSKY